jgi:hypothetical protein
MPGSGAVKRYRCGMAARWLPRTLAASVLVSAVLAAYRFDPYTVLTVSKYVRSLMVVLAGAVGLWILRKGGEVRTEIEVGDEELVFRHGSSEYALRLEDLSRFDYETPFAQTRTWMPALVLQDRFGQQWRISAFLDQGAGFVRDLLRGSNRSDLEAWSETLHLPERMGRANLRVAIGYLFAAAVTAAGVLYHFHG